MKQECMIGYGMHREALEKHRVGGVISTTKIPRRKDMFDELSFSTQGSWVGRIYCLHTLNSDLILKAHVSPF